MRTPRRRNERAYVRNVRTYGPTEAELQADVMRLLKLAGWLAYHTFDSRRSAPGFPDIVAIRGTRLLVLELKTAKGKATSEQLAWLTAFAGAGAECYLVRPQNIDELAAIVAR